VELQKQVIFIRVVYFFRGHSRVLLRKEIKTINAMDFVLGFWLNHLPCGLWIAVHLQIGKKKKKKKKKRKRSKCKPPQNVMPFTKNQRPVPRQSKQTTG
jgi:hypothetical protein